MLLTRVASTIYWFGRYLERAENTTRHLSVAWDYSLELAGIHDEFTDNEWRSLVHSISADSEQIIPKSSRDMRPIIESLLYDGGTPASVLSSIARARDNARSISESTPTSVIIHLNEAHRLVQKNAICHADNSQSSHESIAEIQAKLLTILGAIEHTWSRNESWNYMKCGEAMERTQKTLLVMRRRLSNLMESPSDVAAPVYFSSWRSLLTSLASDENYRLTYGARFQPDAIVKFLLFDKNSPRSMACGVMRMSGYLSKIADPGPGAHEARRLLGRLAAQLEYDQEAIMASDNLGERMTEWLADLRQIHESMINPMRRTNAS